MHRTTVLAATRLGVRRAGMSPAIRPPSLLSARHYSSFSSSGQPNRFQGSSWSLYNAVMAAGRALAQQPVAQPSQVANRVRIDQQLDGHQNAYSRRVLSMNRQLDHRGEPLSVHAANALIGLANQVERGEITDLEAHSYEAVFWMRHASENYGACVVGFLANAGASVENDLQQRDREHNEDNPASPATTDE